MPSASLRDSRITAALSKWFEHNARTLPWRTAKRDAYASLVSEIMLQQTQVSRVINSYRAFMKRFPTNRALAHAAEQDVIRMWCGLGYYRRARHLWQTAKIIQNDFRGRFPQTVADLRKLPGVGRYTAGAIASIVFGRPEPIVDGNVKRVLGRVDAEKFDSPRHADAWSWIRAEELVSAAENPGVFNEALMELGATICSPPPAVPKCGKCPIRRQCKGRISGIATLSVKGGTPDPKPVVHHHVMVISRTINRNPHVLMQQRKPQGMWAGMWEPFTLESDAPLSHAELKRILIAPPWPKGLRMSRVADFTHQTTHRQIEFHVMRAAVKTSLKSTSGLWVKVKSALDMPMGNAQRKALRLAIDDK